MDAYSHCVPASLDTSAYRVRLAHGILLSITFILIKPFGALCIRCLGSSIAFKTHVTIQSLALLAAGIAVGLGIWLANYMNRFGKQHPIIGFVIIALILLQVFLGTVHHQIYLRTRKGSMFGILHTWIGRAVISLGIINGGIGLADACVPLAFMIVYSVSAVAMFVIYIVALAVAK